MRIRLHGRACHLLNSSFWAFVFLCCLPAKGQDISFNHLTIENGLSQNSVLAIAQDTRGFMWFGTRYGLNRYDGYRFVCYKNNPADTNSLSDNYINALLCDSKKNLWAGTDKGLNKYDPEKNHFSRIALYAGKRSVPYAVHCIMEDKNGTLWVGTTKGLCVASLSKNKDGSQAYTLKVLDGLHAANVVRIYKDAKDYIWLGTSNGLIRLKYGSGKTEKKLFIHDSSDPASLSDNYIMSITEDKMGNLWIATIKGLNLYNTQTQSFTRFLSTAFNGSGIVNNNVRVLVTDRTGKLWIGTQEGLSIMDPATKKITSYQYNAGDVNSLSQNSVHSIFEDANGSVWVGTFFGGVNVAYRYTTHFTAWQHSQTASSISNNVISSIVADEKDNLWIGTEGGGLNYFDKSTQKFTVYKNDLLNEGSLGSNLVKTVYIDTDNNLWVGTHGGGLNLFDPVRQTFHRFLYKENDSRVKQSEIAALLEDSEGKLWVGKHPGIEIFYRNETNLTPYEYNPVLKKLEDQNLSAIVEDSKKNIWIGTLNGLYIFQPSNGSLNSIEIKNKNFTTSINCIKEDSRGNIWIGLHYGGMAMYDAHQKEFVVYTTKDGLPNDNVLGILEDEYHNLWLSTSNGLAKFNPVNKNFQTYTSSDGLAGNEFNYNAFFKRSNGEIFFGGINGLTSFFPDRIERNENKAPLIFTGLKIFSNDVEINDRHRVLTQSISLTNKLIFHHNQNTFTLEFALLNFIKPGKNKYAYKLEGINTEWTEVTNPSATFTNLAEGHYVFLVKGANNDGVWTEPVRLQISVLPPFWKTWWAYLLYACFVALILFFVIRFFYVRALLLRDKELHRVKLNFFTNISHEIRTHLTLIMAPVEKMQKENNQNIVLSHQLKNIKDNANRLLKLVNELMDFRKAETNNLKLHVAGYDLISFLNSIYTSFEELSLTKNIRLSFVHDAKEILLFFDKEQLEKVIFNLLTNAFKFTHNGGSICLHVESKKDTVKIHVVDNGRGIAPAYFDKLFTNFFQVNDNSSQNTGYGIGLALSKTIIALHKGTLTVESIPQSEAQEQRTCFTVTLLKGNRHFENVQQPLQTGTNNNFPQKFQSAPAISSVIESEEKNFTVLISEDNSELRSLIKESLESYYNVIESEDGLQGWQIATEQIPDLIVSDVMMPEMDGFTLCEKLKTDERTSHIPVILLTAKTSQTDHVSGLTTGADVYLTKPFSTEVLELSVRNLLAAREKMRQKFSKEFVLQPQNIVINTVDEQFVKKLIQIIEDNMDNPEFGVDMLSVKIAMSQSVLYKKVKAITGMSVNDFSKSMRLKKAAQLLQQKTYTVYEVGYMVGFNDRKYFSKEFKKQFGKTPSEYAGGSTNHANGLQHGNSSINENESAFFSD
jgi:ligand-binding sensor domain-containing protein/signal transduction histidine kinase/DNA-binding response OmpR family regulator